MEVFEITKEMEYAMWHIRNNIIPLFITGKAGAGKTTFLKHLVKTLDGEKNIVVTASTGVAAINAGGITLHSLLRIPLHIITPDTKLEYKISKNRLALIRAMDVLVIDEVSMVRADIIDYIDKALKHFRKNYINAFGGVKVVFFGDMFQLPPVVQTNDAQVLYKYYKTHHFFAANIFKVTDLHIVELAKVFRQKDENFVHLLNSIRQYQFQLNDIYKLAETVNEEKANDYNSKSIHLCALKATAESINKKLLGEPTHTFYACIKDKFDRNSMPCDDELNIKEGARVMIIANDHDHHLYVNGTLGTVEKINPDNILVKIDDGDITVSVEKYTWEKIDYVVDEFDKVEPVKVGECTQFPLTLAWAITIHKSQGLTFDNVTIHAKQSFAPGQIYVALSRCRTLEGITTDSMIMPQHIIPDQWLLWFDYTYKQNKCIFRFKPEK